MAKAKETDASYTSVPLKSHRPNPRAPKPPYFPPEYTETPPFSQSLPLAARQVTDIRNSDPLSSSDYTDPMSSSDVTDIRSSDPFFSSDYIGPVSSSDATDIRSSDLFLSSDHTDPVSSSDVIDLSSDDEDSATVLSSSPSTPVPSSSQTLVDTPTTTRYSSEATFIDLC